MSNKRNIKIFGLGLALLLATGAFLHLLHMHLGVIPTLLIFGFILFIIEKSLVWPLVFATVYGLIAIMTVISIQKHALTSGVIIADAISILVLLATVVKWQLLIPIYQVWMKGAHFLGAVVTVSILSITYFLVFAPVGIFLRIMKKDHLQRSIDLGAKSYWQIRQQVVFSKDSYQKQG